MSGYQYNFLDEMIIDNFAGGGGASWGIEAATGRIVDIAINHNARAIEMHEMNHPATRHLKEDVFSVNPREVTSGRAVGLAWFSPDCTNFSKAKGGTPVKKEIRGLAWVALRWASQVKPRVIFLENVEEFMTWGGLKPIRDKGRIIKGYQKVNGKNIPIVAAKGEVVPLSQQLMQPDPKKKGRTFKSFVYHLERLGYKVEWRVLRADEYGVPTIRKRFYLIARCDGKPIVFPEPTHGKGKGLKPKRTAAEIIDFAIPCPSIFERKKELAENTLKRIARGLDAFTIKNDKPFIIPVGYKPLATITSVNNAAVITPHITQICQNGFAKDKRSYDIKNPLTTICRKNEHCLTAPSLIQYHTEQSNKENRAYGLRVPINTVDGSNRYGLMGAHISKYFSGERQNGSDIEKPLPTVTGIDHNALSTSHLVKYYSGEENGHDITAPIGTITAKDRMAVTENHLCVLRNNMDSKGMKEPLPTITSSGGHFIHVKTYLLKYAPNTPLYYWHEVRELLNKYCEYNIADDEVLILEINGVPHYIADIGMRMLTPRELYNAQGFPPDYRIEFDVKGKPYPKTEQVERVGNSVCPPVATALVRANVPEMCGIPIQTMSEFNARLCGA